MATKNTPYGTETLPEGIISTKSDFEMRSLSGHEEKNRNKPKNLLAFAVGIKQKENFLSSDFAVILFHYDGILDEWREFEWNQRAIHDLGVDNFNTERYLSIVKEEGLEISQPALSPKSTEWHHQLTLRQQGKRVHRRIDEKVGNMSCENFTHPPCTGFVEMMAPVFSKASWRCAWHMIQNDLVHAWGLDFELGYCVQIDPNT
ncbi:hypothetical protein Tsubulata_008729 [Turnera subulata]|uniref:Uncharacterized protein n=1 Tax=Turnera subulata TaxID=218843 RepID=A0A9Q0JJQ1_9ROSI|nr:hypothetical protein Tsubulata_008729 [Turnera subulata]